MYTTNLIKSGAKSLSSQNIDFGLVGICKNFCIPRTISKESVA
jgi:hypothetical protein